MIPKRGSTSKSGKVRRRLRAPLTVHEIVRRIVAGYIVVVQRRQATAVLQALAHLNTQAAQRGEPKRHFVSRRLISGELIVRLSRVAPRVIEPTRTFRVQARAGQQVAGDDEPY